jgi:hypothetical protein
MIICRRIAVPPNAVEWTRTDRSTDDLRRSDATVSQIILLDKRRSHGSELPENPEVAQKTFDLLGSKDKELFWIEGTTRRFKDGYNYFRMHQEKNISLFDKYTK